MSLGAFAVALALLIVRAGGDDAAEMRALRANDECRLVGCASFLQRRGTLVRGNPEKGEQTPSVSAAAEWRAKAAAAAAEQRGKDLELLLEDHKVTCRTTILTDVISGRKDWQRGTRLSPSFDYFERFYESILMVPGGNVQAVVLHDGLPENITSKYATPDSAVTFVKVDLSTLDPALGINDLRFSLFVDQIKEHPEWETVFATDISDVTVKHNPCSLVDTAPQKLYIGVERSHLEGNAWMRQRFKDMGGKYLTWFRQQQAPVAIWNCGIIGGRRDRVLELLDKMHAVVSDPELAVRKQGKEVNVNMAALNWILHDSYSIARDLVSGPPLHSRYKGHEHRGDVYFVHK